MEDEEDTVGEISNCEANLLLVCCYLEKCESLMTFWVKTFME